MDILRTRSFLATVALAATVAPVLATGASTATAAPATAAAKPSPLAEPLVIAHRGASGYRPEHTLEAYELAVEMGADYIEPDVVSTKDGVLVARHENEISGTTDVADHAEYAGRRTTKTIDGKPVTGWFTEDFTLGELKTLRAKERLPQVRPQSATYDGRFEVPTIEEVVDLVQRLEQTTGREIGIAPETKHPTYFDSIGLSLEEPLVAVLDAHGLDGRRDPVVLQSFEVGNLRDLNALTKLPIAQLVDAKGAPYDHVAAGTGLTYDAMTSPAGLKRISKYAEWVAPEKGRILPRNIAGEVRGATGLVGDAHAAGLLVVTWTLRAENQFMAVNFRTSADPNAYGDLAAETHAYLDAGVDAVFSDHPDLAVRARDSWVA